MRENLTSGLKGGSWKRDSPVGHPRVPSRCAEKPHDGSIGTQPADQLSPRQLPTRLRYGVSKRTFSYLDSFAWRRVAHWLRKRHHGQSWKVIRRRFMQGWNIVIGGVTLLMPSTITVSRYRYRGNRIPNPWTIPTPA